MHNVYRSNFDERSSGSRRVVIRVRASRYFGRGHPATTAIRSLISAAVARTFWAISVSASG